LTARRAALQGAVLLTVGLTALGCSADPDRDTSDSSQDAAGNGRAETDSGQTEGGDSQDADPSEPPTGDEPRSEEEPLPAFDTPTPAEGAPAAWDAPADATAASWEDAEQAAEDGAEVIHLRAGTYGDHSWGSPDVLVRNVPGDHVRIAGSLTVVAPGVTVAGVDIDRFSAREGGDETTLLRSHLRDRVNVNGGGEPLHATLREVHRPERQEAERDDIVHVNEGGSVHIDGSYLAGNDLVPGADGHMDTVQLVNGGRELTVTGSYLGRSHNATIIEQDAERIEILDSFLGWSKGNDESGGIGMSFETLDVTVERSVTSRLYWPIDAEEVDVTGMTIAENHFVRRSDDEDDGRIKFADWGQWGDEAYPDNRIVDAERLPEPAWEEPAWWDSLGIGNGDG
jgi:hypothetical protein